MKKYSAVIGFVLCILSLNVNYIQAQDYGDLKMPSKIEILNQYDQQPFYFNAKESTKYSIEPTVGYVYTVGQPSEQELQSALAVTNLSRLLVGIPPDLIIDEKLNQLAQYASYINMLNANISHYPKKPDMVSEEAYQIGEEGSAASNLAAGFPTISNSILWGYLQDDDIYNIGMVGHRRWLLNPKMQKIGFGYVDTLVSADYNGFTATYVFDQSRKEALEYPYIAWPSAGYMPVEFMKTSTPWSIHLGNAYDAPSRDAIAIELTDINSGLSYKFNRDSNDNPSTAVTREFYDVDQRLYGLDKTIIFRPNPDMIEYNKDSTFRVDISGLTIDGQETQLSYQVSFFDLQDRPSDWAYDELMQADQMQIIPETLMKDYSSQMSRIDFTRLLIQGIQEYTGKTYYELLESTIQEDIFFEDTSDSDVELAARLGLIQGIGGQRFNPDGGIRREEAATILYRTGQYLDIIGEENVIDDYIDAEAISFWAKDAVNYVTSIKDSVNGNKVMEGFNDGSFQPQGVYTREQAIITLKRLLNQ